MKLVEDCLSFALEVLAEIFHRYTTQIRILKWLVLYQGAKFVKKKHGTKSLPHTCKTKCCNQDKSLQMTDCETHNPTDSHVQNKLNCLQI